MSFTQQLYQLQQTDSQIDAAHKRLQEIEASLVETEALKSARTGLRQAETTRKKLKAQVADLELEVKGLQQKITRHEHRLYSGKLVNPKEAASLQDEVASSKRWLSTREEALLEVMIELEEAEAALAEQKQVFAGTLAEWETNQAGLLQEKTRQQEVIEQLTKTRTSIAQFIEAANLARYEALRAQKAGVGVTVVQDGNCLSCGVMLSSRLAQQARVGNRLYLCDSCGRIIHIL